MKTPNSFGVDSRTYGWVPSSPRKRTGRYPGLMNEGQTDLLRAVGRVVAVFDALGIDYLVGGSIASSIFGEPRQTVDADLLARILGRHARLLVERLSNEFYIDIDMILSAV